MDAGRGQLKRSTNDCYDLAADDGPGARMRHPTGRRSPIRRMPDKDPGADEFIVRRQTARLVAIPGRHAAPNAGVVAVRVFERRA